MSIQRPLPYLENSESYFAKIRGLGNAVFLDSGRPLCPWGRFDILSAAPTKLLQLNAEDEDAFAQLDVLYKSHEPFCIEDDDIPFQGGLIGHFSYDLGRAIEDMPQQAERFSQLPDLRVGLYMWAVIVDHHKQCAFIIADDSVDETLLNQIEQRLLNKVDSCEDEAFSLRAPFSANMDEAAYKVKLAQVDDYIHSGDCYQVNFAQRFHSQYQGDPWQAYKRLRQVAPTPYSAYLESDTDHILSLSPEQFLESKKQQVTTKPIKGTRPRSSDAEQDLALKQELADSIKDRAENLMIVDLLRNDLSKVCEHNSVKVPKLFNIESYANVHHKVSTVTGRLKQDCSPIALLQHCFPGGSITGAPKIRAMEIIEELEPHRRSIYCGSIGYISFCGRMDTSITIRTLLCENNQIYCWAGGGIVADSVTEMEYAETFSKVNNLLHSLEATITK